MDMLRLFILGLLLTAVWVDATKRKATSWRSAAVTKSQLDEAERTFLASAKYIELIDEFPPWIDGTTLADASSKDGAHKRRFSVDIKKVDPKVLDFFTPMQQPEETDTGSLERVGRNTLREDIDRGYNPPLNADDRKNKDRIDHGLEESTTLRSNFGSADEFRNSKDNIDRGMPDVTSTIRPKYKEPVYGPPPYPTYPPTVSPSTPRDTEEEMTGKESKDAGGEKSSGKKKPSRPRVSWPTAWGKRPVRPFRPKTTTTTTPPPKLEDEDLSPEEEDAGKGEDGETSDKTEKSSLRTWTEVHTMMLIVVVLLLIPAVVSYLTSCARCFTTSAFLHNRNLNNLNCMRSAGEDAQRLVEDLDPHVLVDQDGADGGQPVVSHNPDPSSTSSTTSTTTTSTPTGVVAKQSPRVRRSVSDEGGDQAAGASLEAVYEPKKEKVTFQDPAKVAATVLGTSTAEHEQQYRPSFMERKKPNLSLNIKKANEYAARKKSGLAVPEEVRQDTPPPPLDAHLHGVFAMQEDGTVHEKKLDDPVLFGKENLV